MLHTHYNNSKDLILLTGGKTNKNRGGVDIISTELKTQYSGWHLLNPIDPEDNDVGKALKGLGGLGEAAKSFKKGVH